MPLSFQDLIEPNVPTKPLSFANLIEPVTPLTNQPEVAPEEVPTAETLSSESGFFKAAPQVRIRDFVREAANLFTGSVSGLGQSTSAAIAPHTKDFKELEESKTNLSALQDTLFQHIRQNRLEGKDTSRLEKVLKESLFGVPTIEQINPAMNTTGGQIAGQAGGTVLDIASFGTYGALAKYARTGKLLDTALARLSADLAPILGDITSKTVAKSIAPTLYQTALNLVSKLPAVGEKGMPAFKEVLKEGGKAIGIGAGTGYGYDVTQKLQEGQTGGDAFTPGLGTVVGTVIPGGLATAKVMQYGSRKVAPTFVNSLLGSNSDFNRQVKLGHNPGEAVVQTGIVANNLPELERKTAEARSEIGQMIGGYYDLPENLAKRENYSDIISPLDREIAHAEQNPLSNKAYITRLENAKNDLTNGVDLANMNPKEAFEFKQKLIQLMRFTGAPSDDKGINAALNGVYGMLSEKVNKAVPELVEVNKLYGGLSAAEISARTREQRNVGKNILGVAQKFGVMGGTIVTGATAVATGGISLVPVLAGLGGAALDKLLSTTAVKSRIAYFLSGVQKAEVQSLLRGRTIQDQQIIIENFKKTLAETLARQKANTKQLPAGATPMGSGKDKSGTDYKRLWEMKLYLEQLKLQNTPQLPAGNSSLIIPNTQGTPNQLNRPYGPGGEVGDIGGMRQRLSQ